MAREYRKFRGAVLTVSSCVLFAVAGCIVKQCSYMGAGRVAFFRFAIGLGIIAAGAIFGVFRLRFNDGKLLFLRGLIGGAAVYIGFIAIGKLGLGKGVVLIYSYPVFAGVFGAIFLKERLRLVNFVSIALAFGGIYLLSSDNGGGEFLVFGRYELLTVFGAMLSAIAVTLIRKLHDTDESVSIFFSQCAIGMWVALLPMSGSGGAIGTVGLLMLVAIGVFSTGGQLLMTEGFRYLPVRTGSLFCMLDPVLAFVAGVVIFGEPLVLRSVVGAGLVVGACVVVLAGREDAAEGVEIAEAGL
jgi:drug/metabolite transporter (DMT)-like permease